jgi:hypothetical protein
MPPRRTSLSASPPTPPRTARQTPPTSAPQIARARPAPPPTPPPPPRNSGNFHVDLTFKRRRLRVRVHQDPDGLESSDSDVDSDGNSQVSYEERPQRIGPFLRFTNFVQLDHPGGENEIGVRYNVNGHVLRSFRRIRGPANVIIMLQCDVQGCSNILAFLSMDDMYVFGQHQHFNA